MLAMLVAGYMAKQGGAQRPTGSGGLEGMLGGLLGGQSGGATPGAEAGLGSMLDLNGNGNALDDILRMAGKASCG